ncbi:MAG: GNAT family N-acetyltransferase [Clostridia bacterium]|nr:GNAT family N-acetyltransferase [Clostridia bacterium]
MISLPKKEIDRAAEVFADGFMEDPAFSLLLKDTPSGKALLQQYFLDYLISCKELLLYKCSEAGEGYLCLYRHDTTFADFAVPKPLATLEEFQMIDEFYHSEYAVLDIMAVERTSRGKGLAGEMIDFFVAYCQQNKLLPLVEVFSRQHIALYLAHGFAVAHCRTHRDITTYILEYQE